MVIRELITAVASMLGENARFEAEQLVMHSLGISRVQIITESGGPVTDEEINRTLHLTKRRADGEPLQYILGECEFMSLTFYTERGVLIPRADTETLVEAMLERIQDGAEILDICTGSGCVGISLAKFLPQSRVTMTDISDTALKLAQRNAEENGVLGRVSIIKSDILCECPRGKFDVIVSNPPYIETDVIDTLQTEVKDHEPHLALDGGKDGLKFYRKITHDAPKLLKKGGLLAFEIGFNQAESVSELMREQFENIAIIKDYGGNNRVALGNLKLM